MMPNKIGKRIICPYCDYVHEETQNYPDFHEDGEQPMDCNGCGKTFLVMGKLSWTFKTYKGEEMENEM